MIKYPDFRIMQLVPGGIVPTDHVHVETNDNTCSRCRKAIDEDEVPLMFWSADGRNMLIYCEDCTGTEWAQPTSKR